MKLEITLQKRKDEPKHSVRYDTTDKDAPVQSIYIMRTALTEEKPNTIKVIIEGGN